MKWAFVICTLLLISTGLMAWLQPAAFGLGKAKRLDSNSAISAKADPSTATPSEKRLDSNNKDSEALQTKSESKSYPALLPPPNGIELPGLAVQGQLWAQRLDPKSFFIQHGTFNIFSKAEQMQKLYAGLADSHIVAAYRPGESLAYFILVTGPHSTLTEANEFLKRKDIPASSWVRSSQNLQDQLNPSIRKN